MSSNPATKSAPLRWDQRLLQLARSSTTAIKTENFRKSEEPHDGYKFFNAATSSPTDSGSVSDEAREHLKGSWREGLGQEKTAVDEFIEKLRGALDASLGKDEVKRVIEVAKEEFKKKLADIIDSQTDAAIAYIEKLPESEREKTADYWSELSSCVQGFLGLAMEAATAAVSQIIDLLTRIWEVDGRLKNEVDRAYEGAMWLLK